MQEYTRICGQAGIPFWPSGFFIHQYALACELILSESGQVQGVQFETLDDYLLVGGAMVARRPCQGTARLMLREATYTKTTRTYSRRRVEVPRPFQTPELRRSRKPDESY
jgi:hypothetical protein